MFPTINVYQGNHYPSRILEGYFCTPLNGTRLAALVAEKYGQKFVPEFHMSGQTWFDRNVMGVWTEEREKGKAPEVKTASKEADERLLRDRDGQYKFSYEAFLYNPLHPQVQEMYLSIGIGYGPILVVENEDMWGNEVNLASKLGEDIAQDGEILLTEAAYNSLQNRNHPVLRQTLSIAGIAFDAYKVET